MMEAIGNKCRRRFYVKNSNRESIVSAVIGATFIEAFIILELLGFWNC
jgi:hypothetical protein